MKTLARRGFLQQLGAVAGFLPGTSGICSPAIPRKHKRRISQRELEDAIDLHDYWLEGDSRGARAVFSDCDLSGLDFHSTRAEIINLRGSDFTEADLSATTANQVSFHRASLQSARLSWSHLNLPIFCGATLRRALCDNVIWGWPSKSSFKPAAPIDDWPPRATFINTDLSFTDFSGARVMGYFCGTLFSNASLRDADLSHSDFAGREIFCENSFAGSDLIRTKFQYASIEAARFGFARMIEPDFSFAAIGSTCTWPSGHERVENRSPD